MATYQTTIAEKQLALADRIGLPTVPQLAAIHTRAGVHVATAEFTMPASVAADDLIIDHPLPSHGAWSAIQASCPISNHTRLPSARLPEKLPQSCNNVARLNPFTFQTIHHFSNILYKPLTINKIRR